MILVDTSVWVDHFRDPEPQLLHHLEMKGIFMHSMVLGELACGNLSNRETVLRDLHELPRIPESAHEPVLSLIESERLMGRGVGFIDFHLLCSALHQVDVSLWTRDARLHGVAEDLGVTLFEGD
ncbi:MAG: type II toxin-antitoxin system VapC family toxin [Thiotrichales bacterium]|nr:type II toxin-antitoxin system VapC family toxin [Thiotrichales bacterium]